MDIILIGGLWLRSDIWDEVAAELRSLGANPVQLALPGADDGSADAKLEDQIAALLTAVDQAEMPIVVGHSAASTLAWIAADRRPEAVSRVVLVGGMPASDGASYADFFEPVEGVVPFPGWQAFEGPDAADLDEDARRKLEAAMVPVPVGVAKGVVSLNDDRRFGIPVTMVCPEYSADDARAWLAAGEIPELEGVRELSFIDIDSGHWPMVSRPRELARILLDKSA